LHDRIVYTFRVSADISLSIRVKVVFLRHIVLRETPAYIAGVEQLPEWRKRQQLGNADRALRATRDDTRSPVCSIRWPRGWISAGGELRKLAPPCRPHECENQSASC